jgi:hypothetical protein
VIALLLGGCAVANGLLLGSVWSDRHGLWETAERVVPQTAGEREIVAEMSRFVRDKLYHCDLDDVEAMPWYRRWHYLYNPFRIGPKMALDHGTRQGGACGSSCNVLMELLAAWGLRSRFVILSDEDLVSRHTVLEVYYAESWGVVDPLYHILYVHPDGRPASVRDLRADPNLVASNAQTGWAYGYGQQYRWHRRSYNHIKNSFDNAHYFHYAKFGPFGRALHAGMRSMFGDEATLWIKRPGLYAYPALTTLTVMDGLAVSVLLGWLVLRQIASLRGRGRAHEPVRALQRSAAGAGAHG